jgi:two-component sensor histidine kinase
LKNLLQNAGGDYTMSAGTLFEIRMHDATTPSPEPGNRQQAANRQSRLLVGAGTLGLCVACVLALGAALECHTAVTRVSPNVSAVPSLLYGGVLWLWWAGVVYILWRASRKWPAVLSLSAANVACQVGIGILVTSLHLLALSYTVRFLVYVWPELQKAGYDSLSFFETRRFSLDFLVYALLWAASTVIAMQLASQRDALDALELRQQLSAAHLRALQMQIEPHFLFNTLNAITTLVELGRQREAAETLFHLSAILKTTLTRSTPEKVPLAQELKIVESYLAIERIRFADRLKVEMDVDPSALDGLVPCFLLQPIVENAVRHGIARCEQSGVISTSVERDGARLHLCVRDNGPGRNGDPRPGFGIGLRNMEDRLAHFYQKEFGVKLSEPESGGFEVAITIPYERNLA